MDTVQVRIHRHQPVNVRSQQIGEQARADGFPRMKTLVLTHIGQIGSHQAHGAGT
ncbi:hypothetical protein D3C85_1861630 [compost metagenome]